MILAGIYEYAVAVSNVPSRIFIARLLGLDVFDPVGDRLGRLRDVVVLNRDAKRKHLQPLVVGIVVEVLGRSPSSCR
jgi:sporulation protein YlmC with PRC-barrel domain